MSFIDLPLDLDNIQEDKPVPEAEYTLVITDVKEKNSASGALTGLLVILEIDGQPGAANVMHNLSFPQPEDDESKAAFKMKFLKRFLVQFKVPTPGGQLNPAALPGLRAKCHLIQKEYKGEISNAIQLAKFE